MHIHHKAVKLYFWCKQPRNYNLGKIKRRFCLFKVQEESLNLKVHSKKPHREYLIYWLYTCEKAQSCMISGNWVWTQVSSFRRTVIRNFKMSMVLLWWKAIHKGVFPLPTEHITCGACGLNSTKSIIIKILQLKDTL